MCHGATGQYAVVLYMCHHYSLECSRLEYRNATRTLAVARLMAGFSPAEPTWQWGGAHGVVEIEAQDAAALASKHGPGGARSPDSEDAGLLFYLKDSRVMGACYIRGLRDLQFRPAWASIIGPAHAAGICKVHMAESSGTAES